MTPEERDILLIDCNRKLEEIEKQKQQKENEWTACYNEKYRRSFAIEDGLGNIASSSITGIVLVGSACALAATGHSMALTFGAPLGGYATVGLSAIVATLANGKKKSAYWKELGSHESIKSNLEEESNTYKLVSKYITMGDKYLLQLYKESLEVNEEGSKDEFWYLDFDTTNLSPLMLKAIEEIKTKSVELRDGLRNDILKNISSMHSQIAESTTITIPELEAVEKVLKQHVPVSVD